MRSFLLAPFLAASAVSALAIDLNPRSDLEARTPPPLGASYVGSALFRRGTPASNSHKRLIRRKRCRANPSSSSSSSENTQDQSASSKSKSEDGQPPQTDNQQPTPSPENGQGDPSPTSSGENKPWESSAVAQPTSSSKQEDGAPAETWGENVPFSTNDWSQSATTSKPWNDSQSSGGQNPTPSASDPATPSSTGIEGGSQGQAGGGMQGDGALMPVSGSKFWSTANGGTPMAQALKVQSGKLGVETAAPDGAMAMACNYQAGKVGGSSGLSFYASGQINDVDIVNANEVLFSYSVFFDNSFSWVKGGKLPGLYGGVDFDGAKSCSGGSKREDCFSARMMWRADGAGEIYDYLPPSADKNYCNIPPMSECNDAYGASIGRGAWTWKRGEWNTVAMRVKLNTAGQKDGEQQIWLNGESVLDVKQLQIRMQDNVKFQGIMAQSFFGGSNPSEYAPDQEQHSWFKDWTLAILN